MESLRDQLENIYSIRSLPVYQPIQCSDRKTKGEDCDLCAAVCPAGVYPSGKRKKPDYRSCLRCGLCSANCPSRCIVPPLKEADSYLMAIGKKGAVSISCRKDISGFSLRVYCIASLCWEQLAYLALTKGLLLDLSACKSCTRNTLPSHVISNLDRLRLFIGKDVYSARVQIVNDASYVPHSSGLSRRELFQFYRHIPLDIAVEALPSPMQEKDSALFYRAMLRDAVRSLKESGPDTEKPKYTVLLPSFSENCTGCNTCALTCPRKALTIVRDNETIIPVIDVWRCVGCGLCVRTCREQAITGISPMKVTTLGKIALKKILRRESGSQ